jgi:DNA-binding winged helix-turn-helix (wHTH) protein
VVYSINGFQLSTGLDSATKENRSINLSSQEVNALKLFIASEGGIVETKTLENVVWGDKVVTNNSVRKLISELRHKFEDKQSFKNIRGSGYHLTYQIIDKKLNKQHKIYKHNIFIISILISFLIVSLVTIKNTSSNRLFKSLPKVSTQTIFESKDYILDYATHNGAMYVTARNKKSSKLYKVKNRQNTILKSANYSGAYRGIEIHNSGRTIMHVVEKSKCKIKVFRKPVEDQIDEIPCNRQNAFPSFDWIDENSFFVTFNVEPRASIKPFIYNLLTKRLEEVTTINLESESGNKFIDAFIKYYDNGLFSLRENHLDFMSLIFFKGEKRKELYQFRTKPYSIAVGKDSLYFVGNNNELLQMKLTDDLLSKEIDISLLLAPQASKIDNPLVLEEELYFSLGNVSNEVIYSTSGDFTYALENGIRDFTYTDKVLSILALTNTGYVIEQLNNGNVFNTIYLDTDLSLRHVAFFQGELYLAGGSGVYKIVSNSLAKVSPLKTSELISNGQCMIAEGNGIYKFHTKTKSFNKLVEQGERAFQSEKGCLFVETLTGNIVNESREVISKQKKNKLLIEHKGKIAHRYYVNDKTHIVDLSTDNIITKINSRPVYKKVTSYGDDILYLGQADVNTSIMKLDLE